MMCALYASVILWWIVISLELGFEDNDDIRWFFVCEEYDWDDLSPSIISIKFIVWFQFSVFHLAAFKIYI